MSIARFAISFCVAALPAVAIAQSAVQYQAGSDNEASLQQAGGVGNVSLQYQDGRANLSEVAQTGGHNDARIDQQSSFSEAAVSQVGQYNRARIHQMRIFPDDAGQQANIHQSGDANRVSVVQEYRSNDAKLRQQGDRNSFEVHQHWDSNVLVVDTTGSDNRLYVSQHGYGRSFVEQSGNANQTSIEQHVYPFAGTIRVSQLGVANRVDVTQRGSSRHALGDVELEQIGSDNLMSVEQSSSFDSFRFTQDGTANQLEARQWGRILHIDGSTIGNRNQVTIDQRYDFATLQISQHGDDNVIDVRQYDLDQRSASVAQVGDANQAILTQGWGSGASERYAAIVQHGSGNLASLSQ
jgi:hypothetical protein